MRTTKQLSKMILLLLILFLFSAGKAYCTDPVAVEFFYWDPSTDPNMCQICPGWLTALEDYQNKSAIVEGIETTYGNNVSVYRIPYESPETLNLAKEYNLSISRNSLVVNHEYLSTGTQFTEENVSQIIDAYLAANQPPPPPPAPPLMVTLALAFTFGFFETFSPCLVILLSFALTYTVGEDTSPKRKTVQVMAFGIGFVTATVLVFSTLAAGLIYLSSMLSVQYYLMLAICGFSILFGLNLLGLNFSRFLRKADTKPMIQKLTKKHAVTLAGLGALGFTFYFLDPCIAPVFVGMLATFQSAVLYEALPLILFVFCLGVIVPFVIIGVVAGSVSRLARNLYKQKSRIRAVSGLILIVYSIYLLLHFVVQVY